MISHLLAWPDELNSGLSSVNSETDCDSELLRALFLFRHSRFQEMEALIFTKMPEDNSGDFCFLYVYSLFWRNEKTRFLDSFRYFASSYENINSFSPILSALFALVGGEYKEVYSILDAFETFQHEQRQSIVNVIKCHLFFAEGKLEKALSGLAHFEVASTLEGTLLHARILKIKNQYDHAIQLLDDAIQRAPNNLQLVSDLITILHSAKRGDRIMTDVKKAISTFGENALLMSHLAPLKLMQREPARSLKATLKERSFNSITKTLSKASNLFVAYEHLGHSNWGKYAKADSILLPKFDPDFYANRCLQLASSASSELAVAQAQVLLSNFGVLSKIPFDYKSKQNSRRLKIAWLTGDCTNHPVARFLLGIFRSIKSSCKHEHTIVSTVNHREMSWLKYFSEIKNINTYSFDESHSIPERLKYLRSQNFDVAVDLSGWTGGNSLQLFYERFAFVQVNYLGYFASTGLQTMDFWLGDNMLFPKPCTEKHTEAIYRLSRPFIAWQPVLEMPEFSARISKPPNGPLRIGTFNHNRKFSDDILQIWAKILKRIPKSKIIFKASNSDDPCTKELLNRRLLGAELDPQRIEWLPITKTPEEHLLQYSQLDLSLDCYPNGGCTTTCEALWMGVPSITLAGDCYVSRMSTAVLAAANLSNLIANSPEEYVDIVCRETSDLDQFRAKRTLWRQKLQSSQLGNACELFDHLEMAFEDMVAIKTSVRSC